MIFLANHIRYLIETNVLKNKQGASQWMVGIMHFMPIDHNEKDFQVQYSAAKKAKTLTFCYNSKKTKNSNFTYQSKKSNFKPGKCSKVKQQ